MTRATLLPLLLACEHGFADPSRERAPALSADAPRHAEEIHLPNTIGVDTTLRDGSGAPVSVRCATCHDATVKDRIAEGEGAPETFHTGVSLRHGELGCDHCHDPDDRARLRLADGERIALTEAMRLCAQCHGTQARDYKHGAHGGMAGHWDLRQGPRDRNHCLDCHAAHTPAFEGMSPVLPPRDRFFTTSDESHP